MIYQYLSIVLSFIALWGIITRKSLFNVLLNLQMILVSLSLFFFLTVKVFGDDFALVYSVLLQVCIFILMITGLVAIKIIVKGNKCGK